MFEQDENIQRLIEAVYDLTVNLDRGDILTHEAIMAIVGLQPHEGSWGYIVKRARRRLEDVRGISTWEERTVGYRLLTVREQLQDLPRWRGRRMRRQNAMRLRAVMAIPEARLTLNQRKAKAVQIHIIKDSQRTLRREAKESEVLLAVRPITPRRPAIESGS